MFHEWLSFNKATAPLPPADFEALEFMQLVCSCLNETFDRTEKLVQISLPDIFFYHNPVKGKEECI